MSDITIVHLTEGKFVVSTEILAAGFGVSHQAVLKLLQRHDQQFQALGGYGFEVRNQTEQKQHVSVPKRPVRFAYLNRQQATFLGLLTRNTPRAVQFKVAVAKRFQDLERRQGTAQLSTVVRGALVSQRRKLICPDPPGRPSFQSRDMVQAAGHLATRELTRGEKSSYGRMLSEVGKVVNFYRVGVGKPLTYSTERHWTTAFQVFVCYLDDLVQRQMLAPVP